VDAGGVLVTATVSPASPAAGDTLRVEISVADVVDLAVAAVRWGYLESALQPLSVEAGGLLGEGAEYLLTGESRDPGLIELSLGRLTPDSPAISGAGTLAVARFVVLRPELTEFAWGYDLRASDNTTLARNLVGSPAVEPPPPTAFLLQSYPNPSRPQVDIVFNLEVEENVRLTLHDSAGRLVRRLHEESRAAPGPYRFLWDGADESGRPQPAGVYILSLRHGSRTDSRQLTLLP
jgi:hypothetical protein